jgi:hypothetical protein
MTMQLDLDRMVGASVGFRKTTEFSGVDLSKSLVQVGKR